MVSVASSDEGGTSPSDSPPGETLRDDPDTGGLVCLAFFLHAIFL